jgi:Tol biopolymer transport system component
MRRILWGAALATTLALTVTPAHAAPDRTERVSTGTDGTQLATASGDGSVSADGRYAVYGTLGPADGCSAGFSTCVFVTDLRTGTRIQVPGTGPETYGITISADGSHIGYTTGTYHFFKATVYDRASGELQQLWPANPPTDTWYERSDITGFSADGDHVAYTIGNRNGNSGSRHLLVRDLATGADEVIDPVDHLGFVTGGQLSADGRFVAYGLRNGPDSALYVEDRASGVTTRVDTGTSASLVQISADGRRVLFNSLSDDGTWGAYIRDLRTGRVRSVAAGTAEAADASLRYVLLAEDAGLVLLDSRTGARHTVAPPGSTAVPGSVARHGRSVVFTSTADDLVPNDTNGVSDVFVSRP